ncbi:hypothetical protein [Micromonospora sp. WMMD987]|uniref:effector-associated constant component EACC1 n=1 Tax=Micromonospora TaxID=1873 RepID=UPI00249B13BA|nr:hypothetical protein [Micromonospora sp. WMMD987]WFE97512.1 hypothetical protein O7612_11845 [Micromonospora sp. WMMD987]
MGAVTPTPDVPATGPAGSVRLQVAGRGADRELDALASWLRGNTMLGGGWPVSRLRPEDDPDATLMGVGDLDTLLVILQSGLGLGQLVVAVEAWRDARAAKGRGDLVVTITYQGNVTIIGDHVVPSGRNSPPVAGTVSGSPTDADDDER